MRSRTFRFLLTAASLAPFPLMAAESAAAESSSFNPALLGLCSIIVVLMAAVAMLANVLRQLALAYRDNFRKEREGRAKNGTAVKPAVLLLIAGAHSFTAFAGEAVPAAEEAVEAVSPFISGIPRGDFYLITGVIFFELLLILVLLGMIRHMVRLLRHIPEERPLAERIMQINLLDYFNKSVAVEQEHTIVIDHDYDGIHELDNSLPPWWKWGFVMTIIFSFGYMYYYHMADGPSQIDEYVAAMAKGEQEKQAYLAKAGNSIDENNITLIDDAGKLADAQVLFNNTCAACHRADGGGGVGPNLTDDYWLHGGSLKDVFKSVKYGWKDKGMPEWQHNMSASQIAGITSYIMTLKGKNPPGAKGPQGERYVDNAEGAPKDSTAKGAGGQLTQAHPAAAEKTQG